MKKAVLGVLAVQAAVSGILLSGCQTADRQGTADNEVLTLTEVPEDKLMITMRMSDGMNYDNMECILEDKFPEVDIVVRNNTSLDQSIEYRDMEDIILMVDGSYVRNDLSASFMDLSAETYVQNYYLSTLRESELDGKLYYLPGPSNIYGIVYNKDMFEEYGWQVPHNIDEFIELCLEIEQTGIRAIQPALYFKDAVRQFFAGFTYRQILSGVENEKWMLDYRAGNAVMEGHIEPAFDILDRLIEAGILRAGDFEVQPGTRSEMMYVDQSCAMILETQAAVEYASNRAGVDAPELGLMPFFSDKAEGGDYFLSVPIYNVGASKALKDKGNEEKLKKVKEILAYLSTAEGQKAVMGENKSMISSVKGVEYEYSEFLKNAKDTIEKGHVIPQPFFVEAANTEVDQVLKEDLKLYVEGNIDRAQFMSDLDYARDQVLNNKKASETITVGTAGETFSVLQTACLLAEVFKQKTGAQIGLCAANTRESGNNWKIYKGDIRYGRHDTIDYYLNLSFQHMEDRNQLQGRLVKVKMTGQNILKALNTPYLYSPAFPDTYLTASGLKITFAPWAGDGNRYVSVRLADNTELNPHELYTVAFWNGTVDPELIESVEEEYADMAADLLQSWVQAQGRSIEPDNSDFILDWSLTEAQARE